MANRILAALCSMALAMPAIALAQTPSPPTLQGFIASPQFQAYIGGVFSRLPPDIFRRCSTLVSEGSTVVVSTLATFASDGHPVSGAWRQSFPVSGCGNDTTINLFFAVQADGHITTVLGAPGDTHADPMLQKDAARYAMIAATARAASCADPHVVNTAYNGTVAQRGSSNAPAKRPWHETWTMAACGSMMTVGINFIPDATGTIISTEPARPVN